MTMDTPSPPSTETEVGRLRQLHRDGRHAEALEGAEALLARLPENRDLLLIAAASLRYLSRLDEALAMLDRLERFHPQFSQMHQERGLCHVARKDAPPAIGALLRAVNINPALPMSWRMLEGALSSDRRDAKGRDRRRACRHPAQAAARSGDRDLAFFRWRACAGRTDRARLSAAAWRSSRGHAAVWPRSAWPATCWMMPNCCWRRLWCWRPTTGRRGRLCPDPDAAAQIPAGARTGRRLLKLDPGNLDYLSLAATIAVGLGEHEEAIALYQATAGRCADNPRTCICGWAMR